MSRGRSTVAAASRRKGNVGLGGERFVGFHGFRNIYPRSFREFGTAASDTGENYYNRYNNPDDTSLGDFRYAGGRLRDKRIPADVLPAGTQRGQAFLYDSKQDIQDMIAAGFDTEFIDLLAMDNLSSREWYLTRIGLQAADEVDPSFRCIAMPDCTGTVNPTPAQMTTALLDFASYPAAKRIGGRFLVAPFTPEQVGPAYWAEVQTRMTAAGQPVVWLWCPQMWHRKFNNADAQTVFQTYSTFANTWGMTSWGDRSPAQVVNEASRAGDTRGAGLNWVGGLANQDNRPYSGIYDEPNGTECLTAGWMNAINGKANGVQVITGYDFSESSHIGWSVKNQNSWLEINRFWRDWYKTGVQPVPTRDLVAVVHRQQHTDKAPSYPQTLRMSLRGGSTPTQNMVEVYTCLTAPAQVTPTIGGVVQAEYTAPAGPFSKRINISLTTAGAPSAVVKRGGATVVSVTSRNTITTTPYTEDFTYYATHAYGASPSAGNAAGTPALVIG